MSGHGHVGGVLGTTLLRGTCPHCGLTVAGGNVMHGQARNSRISLRPHKMIAGDFALRSWCPGGRSIVDTDWVLTTAYGKAKQERERKRRERRRS